MTRVVLNGCLLLIVLLAGAVSATAGQATSGGPSNPDPAPPEDGQAQPAGPKVVEEGLFPKSFKVPGTDLRAGVPTMPYLLLGRATDPASRALKVTIDEGVARISDGADPAILDAPLAQLRDHPATEATRRLAHDWSDRAVAALAPLPDGLVREALTRFAQVVVDRSS